MGNVQFGGKLGAVFDLEAHVSVSPRCMGRVEVPFEPPDPFTVAARASLLRHASEQLLLAMRSKSFLSIDQDALGNTVAAAASVELGVAMKSTMFKLGLSSEDEAALEKAVMAAAAAKGAQKVAEVPSSTLTSAIACPRCRAAGTGKFCASCGSPMIAPAPAPVAPSSHAPPPTTDWLTSPINEPIGTGSQIDVPDGFAFVGFINFKLVHDLRVGRHTLPQGCDLGCYVRLGGLRFDVSANGKRTRGTLYVQDPIVQFRAMRTVDASYFDILAIVLSRCMDSVGQASSARELCQKVSRSYPDDDDSVKGTIVVVDSIE